MFSHKCWTLVPRLVFHLIQLVHLSGSMLKDLSLLSDAQILNVIKTHPVFLVGVLRLESICVNENSTLFLTGHYFKWLLVSCKGFYVVRLL